MSLYELINTALRRYDDENKITKKNQEKNVQESAEALDTCMGSIHRSL